MAPTVAPVAQRQAQPIFRPNLRYGLAVDLAVTLTGATYVVLTETALKPLLAPAMCRWCDRDAAGVSAINPLDRGVREALRWSDPIPADTVSNITGYALTPLGGMGLLALSAALDGRASEIGPDMLIVAESTAVAATVYQTAKFIAGRERPFVHALMPDERAHTHNPTDNNVSFFSGHTSITFALAVSAGTVASMRRYRFAPLVWATGLTFATATGWLRIAGDRHYFTDVLTGALVGSLFGVGIPMLFHRPLASEGAQSARVTGVAFAPSTDASRLLLSGIF
ncbi:MAG: phosphatase PAP2 family protein [Deltaproteobacteria bacterium]|nr:phosphatase PAP2 family protein [Deltaproteobacteria bacterium]